MRSLDQQLRRYLITDPRADTPEQLIEIVARALDGGMTAVQLRVKGWSDSEALRAARGVRSLCEAAQALFVVNDRVDIALASGADGVHLGVDDLSVFEARRLLGWRTIIGYSPECDSDRRAAELAGADYLGVGPVYNTSTKGDAGPAIGLDGFASVALASTVPVIGVGGITIERAPDVRMAGAVGVAVVGAVFFASDPTAAARRLAEALP